MKIISIDPGYEKVGVAVIEKTRSGEDLLFSECFKTSSKEIHHKRLSLIGESLRNRIEEYKPDVMAIETLFFNKNHKTAMTVSEARGVVLYEASRAGLDIFEYTPLQIKIAVTGYGRSEKEQVTRMVKMLIKIDSSNQEKAKKEDDEYDAIAVGLTHSANSRGI